MKEKPRSEAIRAGRSGNKTNDWTNASHRDVSSRPVAQQEMLPDKPVDGIVYECGGT